MNAQDLNNFISQIDQAIKTLDIESKNLHLIKLQEEANNSNIWLDSNKASQLMQDIAVLSAQIEPWLNLRANAQVLVELAKNDDDLATLEAEYLNLVDQYKNLKYQIKFRFPYDDYPAIMVISAGAGGTDAQDWAEMLMNMYLKYFIKQGFKYTILDQSLGLEAGIKSVVIDINSGYNIYGHLKSEHGVHRLVRLSPFNADNLRQTSFALVEVSPKISRPDEVKIDPQDLRIDVYRSSGHGGQSVNTTDSAVRITHLPTGINVAIQSERSQLKNKEIALSILRTKLNKLLLDQHIQDLKDLRGDLISAEWGSQIRNYVLHPYKLVKDLRTNYQTNDVDSVLSGNLAEFIEAYLDQLK